MASHTPDPASDEARAIADHFEGDAALYAEFHASCRMQFPLDIAAGDAACLSGDLPALRRLAHSLATVLQALGHPSASELAHQIEDQAAAGGTLPEEPWRNLRRVLQALSEPKI